MRGVKHTGRDGIVPPHPGPLPQGRGSGKAKLFNHGIFRRDLLIGIINTDFKLNKSRTAGKTIPALEEAYESTLW